jgi:hypothetical protein
MIKVTTKADLYPSEGYLLVVIKMPIVVPSASIAANHVLYVGQLR